MINKESLDKFLKNPKNKNYINETLKFCREHGYINNSRGERIYFAGINNDDFEVRNLHERAAIEALIKDIENDK